MTDVFAGQDYQGERHKGWRYGALWCCKHDLDGDVTLSPAFVSEGNIAKLDLLSDWIGLLQREYDAVYKAEYGDTRTVIAEAMGHAPPTEED